MKTVINDDFPFEELECQYFDTCKFFDGKRCLYNQPCKVLIQQDKYAHTLRHFFNVTIDDEIPKACLEMQIDLIMHEHD